jgi:hypothetical protein
MIALERVRKVRTQRNSKEWGKVAGNACPPQGARCEQKRLLTKEGRYLYEIVLMAT